MSDISLEEALKQLQDIQQENMRLNNREVIMQKNYKDLVNAYDKLMREKMVAVRDQQYETMKLSLLDKDCKIADLNSEITRLNRIVERVRWELG